MNYQIWRYILINNFGKKKTAFVNFDYFWRGSVDGGSLTVLIRVLMGAKKLDIVSFTLYR